jgi:hypothetical protein
MGRNYIINHQNTKCKGTDFYEFGVYNGDSMVRLMNHIPLRKAFGFDSFEGIPQEEIDKYNRDEWRKGFCDVRKKLECTTAEEAKNYIHDRLCNEVKQDFVLINGYWDKVLTDNLIVDMDMKSAKVVDIDCDIYSSACQALDFLFRNHLVVEHTLFYFDDWGGTMDKMPEYAAGESRAWLEKTRQYGIEAEKVFMRGTPPHIGTVFEITTVKE